MKNHTEGVEGVIDRLRIAHRVKTDAELARLLGVGRNTVNNWRRRDSTPYTFCERLAREKGYSMDWLVLGIGPKHRPGEEGREEPQAPPPPPPPVGTVEKEHPHYHWHQIIHRLWHWWRKASTAERHWLEHHLLRTVHST